MSEWTEQNEHDSKIYTEGYNDGYDACIDDIQKYKWHDLRKNPEDLPEPLSLCIICVKRWSKIIDDWIIGDYKLTEFTDGFEYAKGWDGLPEPEVLAWKYFESFEPFEEV